MKTRLQELVSPVLRKIDTLRQKHAEPVLVAIDGRSGVGKSLLGGNIAAQTHGALISGDDFYAGGTAVHVELSAESLADICIDRKRLRTVLLKLKSGRDETFHPFDWEHFDGRLADQEKTLKSNAVLILEGVYSFHPDFRDLVDLSVLIETPEATRLQRLISREGQLSEWERQWHRAEDWYFDTLSSPDVFELRIMNV
ncbi:MAG: hypothetical protein AAFW68_10215 [Pseudomonadota bacterium]